MSKESVAQQRWARNYLAKSDRPFAKETLEVIGEIDGITKRLSDGRLVTTPEMTNEIITGVPRLISDTRKSQRRRLKLVPLPDNKEKPDSADK